MEILNAINDGLGSITVLIILLVGIVYTFRLRGFQFTKFRRGLSYIFGKLKLSDDELDEGEVSPFQAVSTALAGAFGVGNISGVTTAITLGGPGALVWLVISALLGMVTKYAEIYLSVRFREKNDEGEWIGGPMYYIKNGLNEKWHWLAYFFAMAAMIGALTTGNGTQVGNIADSINTSIQTFIPAAAQYSEYIKGAIGLLLAVLIAYILFGGVQRIGSLAESIVPPMALIYLGACLIAIFANYQQIPYALKTIFIAAFNPKAIFGGMAAVSIKSVINYGIRRGIFSNEAGLGTAPMAHAATSESVPTRQGYYALLEVFSTLITCIINGLLIVVCLPSDVINYGTEGTNALNAQALGTVFGDRIGSLIIAVALSLFAFTTIVSWGLYGLRCAEYIFGPKGRKVFTWVYVVFVFVSSLLDLGFVWSLSDMANSLMIIPNCTALLFLSGEVARGNKNYFENNKVDDMSGKKKEASSAS